MQSNKTKRSLTLVVITLLIVSMSLIIIQPAQSYVINITTRAYACVSPNPQQVDQQTIISFRIDKALANAAIDTGLATGFMIKITTPNGNTENFGPYTADSTSGSYF